MAISWFLPDQATAYTDKILKRLGMGQTAAVPAIWKSEFCNVVGRAVKLKLLSASDADGIIFHASNLNIREQATPSLAALYELQRKTDLSAYDASYLELAIRLKIPLATADSQLAKAAKQFQLQLA